MINRYSFPKHLLVGLNKVFGDAYADHEPQWSKIFDNPKSTKAFEEDQEIIGLGHARQTAEGESVQYETAGEGSTTRYTHVKLTHGFQITREMVDDNQYLSVAPRLVRSMVRGNMQTKETRAANVFNNGFNTSYTGGDGKALLATDHPNARGTWSNKAATPVDLSEAALESALTAISQFTDGRGMKILVKPKMLLVAPANDFNASRILTSSRGRVGNNHNDKNVIYDEGRIPGGYSVNHYLTDDDAWFIITDLPDTFKLFQRQKLEQKHMEDGEREVFKYWTSERYSVGWTDPRGVYGSEGAA